MIRPWSSAIAMASWVIYHLLLRETFSENDSTPYTPAFAAR